jgi:peptide/nickel transport system ATP-binding protein
MSLLEIEDLSISLPGGRAARPIVEGISLRVQARETVGLVGESGCGKSVTVRSVLGLQPRDAQVRGAIRVDGQDVIGMTAARLRRLRAERAAMVFQDPRASVNPLRRIGDFLTESLRTNLGVGRADARSRALELLAAVGFEDPAALLRRHPHELSGGMLQRVMIAGALAGRPQLLLADEPTTALDVSTQADVLAILMRLREEHGLGLLFVTHDLDLAAAICDRIYVMYAGGIVEHQPAERLFERPLHPYTTGLLASRPKLGEERRRLAAIAGRPLGLDESLPGCRFAPRCPHAEDACREQAQVLGPLGPLGEVACRRAAELMPATAADGRWTAPR